MRQVDICSGCGLPKPIFNVARMLCATCNRQRLREAANQEDIVPDDHEMTPKMRKKLCQLRTDYAKLLNLLDKLNFTADEKQSVKTLARPHLALIEEDLAKSGEFDTAADVDDDSADPDEPGLVDS